MRRLRLLAVFMCVMTVTSVQARNRFNVFTYSDYNGISNKRQFYQQLDSFGVSIMQTFIPDSAAYYKALDNLPLELVTHHWAQGYRLWYDSAHILSFDTCNEYTIDGRMTPVNSNPNKGYRCASIIGTPVFDGTIGRTVQQAVTGVNSAGYLQNEFSEGIFHILNKNLGPTPLRYENRLRLLNRNLPDTTVVAVMEFTDIYSNACDAAAPNPYRVVRLDDTLIIVKTQSGADTVPTIDRSPSPTEKLVHYYGCYPLDDNPPTFDGRQFANVSYVHSGQTYRVVPYSFKSRLRVSDFLSSTSYYLKQMDCIFTGGWSMYSYKLLWTGAASMNMDSLYVTNDIGRQFDSLAWVSTASSAQRIADYYNSRGTTTKLNVNGFYIADEVHGITMKSLENAKKVIGALPQGYPSRTRGAVGAYNDAFDYHLGGRYYDTYIEYTGDSSFMFVYYPHRCYITASSEVNNITSWQRSLDSIFAKCSIARQRAQAITQNKGWLVNFWILFPSFDGTEQSGSQFVTTSKMWTKQQMRCAVNMALSQGTKGIGYWLYSSHLGCQPTTPLNFPKTMADVAKSIAAEEGIYNYSPAGQDTLCTLYPATCQCSSTLTCDIRGLVDFNAQNVGTPNSHWWDYRETNLYLDSMAYFFNNATWLSTARWTSNIKTMQGSFIDSVKSLTHFVNDSAYLQVSFFSYQGQNYAYILNRRADSVSGSWQYARVDSQTVRAFWTGQGAYLVKDVYTNAVDTIYDSLGVVRWDHKLMPGQAVLIKSPTHVEYFKGAWSGTWPQYSTIKVTGDIVVDVGKTLSIKTSGVSIMPYTDSAQTYWDNDPTKTELIALGTLRIEGTANNRVILGPSTPGDSSWFGVETFDGGKVVIDNAVIKKAWKGLYLWGSTHDTVRNTRFEDCYAYGVQTLFSCGSLKMANDTFEVVNASYPSSGGIPGGGTGVAIQGCGAVTRVDSSYFHKIKYALNIGTTNTTVSNCKLATDIDYTAGSSAYGVYMWSSSGSQVYQCEFDDYQVGVKVGGSCNALSVSYCDFFSPRADAGQFLPYMRTALYGPLTGTSCIARWNCFRRSAMDQYVYSGNSVFDLGTSGSQNYGQNSFIKDSIPKLPTGYTKYPTYAVNNIGGVTIQAYGNYWNVPATTWKYGPLNASNPLSGSTRGCGATQPKMNPDAETAIAESPTDTVMSIDQNYPNPFNPTTTISFSLPATTQVKLEIVNVLGQVVTVLADGELQAGPHTVQWNGQGAGGRIVSSGVYFYRLRAGDQALTRKMLLMK